MSNLVEISEAQEWSMFNLELKHPETMQNNSQQMTK